mmetsp:Transcript_5518/g.12038  ORF Transcript_5518/g.12038 Transcript_5518/m.12038 type:complete len:285 (-) Transcript_5518:2218-3072(-)
MMETGRAKESTESTTVRNDGIENEGEGRRNPPSRNLWQFAEENDGNDRVSNTPEKDENEEGTSIINSQSPIDPCSSSPPIPLELEVYGSSSVTAKRKSASRQKMVAKHLAVRRGSSSIRKIRELNPSPYFYYIDHSQDVDEKPLTQLSPALSVPNFIIKLHSILVRDILSDVIQWMPHGRSWKIVNQVIILRSLRSLYIFYLTRPISHFPLLLRRSLRNRCSQHTSSKVALPVSTGRQMDGGFDVRRLLRDSFYRSFAFSCQLFGISHWSNFLLFATFRYAQRI